MTNIVSHLVSELKPYEKNAKIHSKSQIQKIADSIKNFGFNQPIVIDKNFVVVVGHGRLEAAKLLKMKEIPCIVAEGLTNDEIKAYRLADNKLNESIWNMEMVISEMETLDIKMKEITGFDADDLQMNLEESNKEIDINDLKATKHECPECGHIF